MYVTVQCIPAHAGVASTEGNDSDRENTMKVGMGDVVRIRNLRTVDGSSVTVPDPTHLTHLQFRRFAGCPICNVQLKSVIARHNDIRSAGIQEVVVFHSTNEELDGYADQIPFSVIGD